MLSIFRSDPTKKLRKRYNATLQEAMLAQRDGDIETYSERTVEAEKIYKEILAIEKPE
ncbi:DUF6435 family protein [Amphritea pacifica]|uniref:Lacal_2735 family protein n=1 Tax=Amphritea pacifica TaxID=2811233 RepID=A0ABS2W7W7_9GAMM|nr:DUF6435 family protein [Amphritea pacifica]MBN0987794.1 Lacal_2735 family protein [Amphritea pacifica]MBN1008071.1 Lacal_2735 family protein [Amphritea pacifica]